MAKLVCIFDPDEFNSKKAEKELGVPSKSLQEILKNKGVDISSICTPTNSIKN